MGHCPTMLKEEATHKLGFISDTSFLNKGTWRMSPRETHKFCQRQNGMFESTLPFWEIGPNDINTNVCIPKNFLAD